MLFKTKKKPERNIWPVGFHIPVTNMERAVTFYELVFNIKMERQIIGEQELAFFPATKNEKSMGGALVLNKAHKPAENGAIIYFSAKSPDMEEELFRVETSKGEIITHKTFISEEIGYIAWVSDTEGNRIAIQSRH